jgi:restriction endonuclease Mrr
MFDPDYRTKGWNKSRYAPKNSRGAKKGRKHTPITNLAGGVGATAFLLTLYVVYNTFDTSNSFFVLAISGGVGIGAFFATGITLLRRESKNIDKKLNPEKYKQPSTKPRSSQKREDDKHESNSEGSAPKEGPERLIAKRKSFSEKEADAIIGEPIIGTHSTMSATEFEQQVAWLLNALTPYRAEVVGGAGDGGIDIKIFAEKNRLIGIVQCKRYKPDKPLAPMHIRSLAGVKARVGVNVAYLATTSYFTEETRKEAKELGIKLLDGDKINRMVYRLSKQLRA